MSATWLPDEEESAIATASLPGGIDIEYEIHGDANAPVVFPVLGITDNITDWPPGLYEPLVAAGYRVVIHELRDSGHSTRFESAGVPDLPAAMSMLERGELPASAYTMHDVAGDALALLDHLNIEHASVVGYSYGGAVAQLLALRAPERVDAMVCLQGSNYDASLPPRTQAVGAVMAAAARPYPTRSECVAAMRALRLATNGSRHAMDDAQAHASAEISVARAFHPEGTARIVLSRLATAPFAAETSAIRCRTLVLHADEDPIFPLAHGEDIAARIPGAQLSVLEGAGHNHPVSLQPVIVERLLEFLGD